MAAVGDGATTAFHSGPWAAELVNAWLHGQLAFGHSNRQLESAVSALASYWEQRNPPPTKAWYHRAFAAQGSFATLVGIDLRWIAGEWRWRCLAVGDSGLFVFDGQDRLIASFPITRSTDFGRDPLLLSTNPEANASWQSGRRLRARGVLPKKGTLLLASDAVARWLLEEVEASRVALDELRRAVTSEGAFELFVSTNRGSGRLADDDSTVVWIERR